MITPIRPEEVKLKVCNRRVPEDVVITINEYITNAGKTSLAMNVDNIPFLNNSLNWDCFIEYYKTFGWRASLTIEDWGEDVEIILHLEKFE